MKVLEIMQGMRSFDPTGYSLSDAAGELASADLAFLERNPSCAQFHQPSWREREVMPTSTAPWGYEWWIEVDNRLKMHSAQYDSSG